MDFLRALGVFLANIPAPIIGLLTLIITTGFAAQFKAIRRWLRTRSPRLANLIPYRLPLVWALLTSTTIFAGFLASREVIRLMKRPVLTVQAPLSRPSSFSDGYTFLEFLIPVSNFMPNGMNTAAESVNAQLFKGNVRVGQLRWSDLAYNVPPTTGETEITQIQADGRPRTLSLLQFTQQQGTFITDSIAVTNYSRWQNPALWLPVGDHEYQLLICGANLGPCIRRTIRITVRPQVPPDVLIYAAK